MKWFQKVQDLFVCMVALSIIPVNASTSDEDRFLKTSPMTPTPHELSPEISVWYLKTSKDRLLTINLAERTLQTSEGVLVNQEEDYAKINAIYQKIVNVPDEQKVKKPVNCKLSSFLQYGPVMGEDASYVRGSYIKFTLNQLDTRGVFEHVGTSETESGAEESNRLTPCQLIVRKATFRQQLFNMQTVSLTSKDPTSHLQNVTFRHDPQDWKHPFSLLLDGSVDFTNGTIYMQALGCSEVKITFGNNHPHTQEPPTPTSDSGGYFVRQTSEVH